MKPPSGVLDAIGDWENDVLQAIEQSVELLSTPVLGISTISRHRNSLERTLRCIERIFPRLVDACSAFRERSMREVCTRGVTMLAPETLAYIFELAVHTQGEPVKAAVGLSHVSKAWRELTIGTPCLWTTIELQSSPERVDMLLLRSKSALVDIGIHEHPSRSMEYTRQSLRRGLAVAIPHGERWRSFICYEPTFTFEDLRFVKPEWDKLRTMDTPNLEHISVTDDGYLIFPHIPALRSLKINQTDHFGVEKRFNELTHLCYGISGAHSYFLDRLHKVITLEIISRHSPRFDPFECTNPRRPRLPLLRDLTLHSFNTSEIRSLLAHIHIPGLSSLHIVMSGRKAMQEEMNTSKDSTTPISAHFPKLTTLSIVATHDDYRPQVKFHKFSRLIAFAPALRSLKLVHLECDWSNVGHAPQRDAPELQSVEIDDCVIQPDALVSLFRGYCSEHERLLDLIDIREVVISCHVAAVVQRFTRRLVCDMRWEVDS